MIFIGAVKHNASISAQTMVRRFVQHRKYRREIASIKMQKSVRRYVQKKKFERDIIAVRAASTSIEKYARSYLARRKLSGSRSKAIMLQKVVRRIIMQTIYLETRRKIIRNQSIIRKFIYKTRFIKAVKSSTKIQSVVRSKEMQRKLTLKKQACLKIQRKMRVTMREHQLERQVSELHEAAISGKTVHLVEMLTERPELRSVRNWNDGYKSLLHSAAQSGELKAVEILLTTFEDPLNKESWAVTVRDKDGNTPLHYACAGGFNAVIQYFSTFYNAQSKAGQAMQESLQRHGTALHRSLSKRMQIKSGSAYSKERRTSVANRSTQDGRVGAPSQRLSTLAAVAAASPPAKARASLNITEFFNDLTSKPRTPSGGVERKSDLDSQNSMSAMSMPAIGSPRLQTFGSASSVGSRKEGILKKRRENGWDGKRWVVIEDSQFMYYSSSRKPKWTDEPVTVLHLSSAVIKKSEKVKFAFEVHSAELLNGRKNTYGRLYFAASSEIELMEWMNFIRSQTEVVSSKSYALKRDSPIIYFDEERRLEFLNLTNKDGETALHALMKGAVKDTQDHTDLYNRSERPLMSSKVEQSRPPVDEINDVQDRIEILLWLVGNGSDIESEDALGLTPLLVAAKVGASTLAKVLVRLGAKTDVETHKDGEDLKKICSENMREGGCDEITNATNVAFDYSQMTAFVQRASRCTYVKLFISKVKLDSSKFAFDDAILQLSVYDGTTELVEKQQITPTWPMITDQHVFWGHTMHMNTPIENLAGQGAGTKIIIEILVKDEGKSERQSVVWAFIELSEKKLDTFTKDLPLYHAPVDKQAGSKNASLVDFDGNMTCELMIINSSLLEVQAAK